MFQGASQINLDAKGRLAVPTRVRDPLAEGVTFPVVLTAHPDNKSPSRKMKHASWSSSFFFSLFSYMR